MALEMEAAPRPVQLAGLPRTAALAVGDGSSRPLTGGLLDPSAGSETGPDPSSDRAEDGGFGTAYRNRGNRPAGSD
jgi:hypothetical protein